MESLVKLDPKFWKNRKVLVTGHTGFKGAWLILFLRQLQCQVVSGFSLPADPDSLFKKLNLEAFCDHFEGDINHQSEFSKVLEKVQPEIIIHMAAQSLVAIGHSEPLKTIETNVLGTAKVILAASQSEQVQLILNVTSDKCYLNHEMQEPFSETDSLGGRDPYSASKACSEIVGMALAESFLRQKQVQYISARSGNVIGPGDHSQYRILPDFFRALSQGQTLLLRSPNSVRPWMYVLDSLYGYLLYIQNKLQKPMLEISLNFGPAKTAQRTVKEVIQIAEAEVIQRGHKAPSVQLAPSQLLESKVLSLDSRLAEESLGWRPLNNFEESIRKTVQGTILMGQPEFLVFAESEIKSYLK